MAQTAFQFMDEGKTLSITNDSGTTAITAGDILYSAANDDVLTGTAANVRAAYAVGDIKALRIADSATGFQQPIGVAVTDIPADGVGMMALEGLWMTPVSVNTEAGDALMGAASANKVRVVTAATAGSTTANATSIDEQRYKVGRAFTGGSADGKYIMWKLVI